MNFMVRSAWIFIFFFFCLSANAQLNLKVGYSLAYTNPETHNSIISAFNEGRPWLESTMDQTNLFNGFIFGARYKIDRIAFEATWENQFDRFSGSGPDPATTREFTQSVFFRQAFYSLGLESFFSERFSVKASLDLNQVRYRSEKTGVSGRFILMKDQGLGSTFSLGYNLIGDGIMHISLRPFFHISWTGFDIAQFSDELDAAPSEPDFDFREDFVSYGLKIIFYNGIW